MQYLCDLQDKKKQSHFIVIIEHSSKADNQMHITRPQQEFKHQLKHVSVSLVATVKSTREFSKLQILKD